MTEIPEHLQQRAERARTVAQGARTGEMPGVAQPGAITTPRRRLPSVEEEVAAQVDEITDAAFDVMKRLVIKMGEDTQFIGAMAGYQRSLYEKLLDEGFSDDQAIAIISQHNPFKGSVGT